MKKIAVLLVLFIALALKTFSQETYKVTGILPTDFLDGYTVKLVSLSFPPPFHVDSATVKNGTFSFTGSVHEPVLATVSIQLEPHRVVIAYLILEQGEIVITFKNSKSYTVSGPPLNQAYYRDMVKPRLPNDTIDFRVYSQSPELKERIKRSEPKSEKDFIEQNMHKYPEVVASIIMQYYMLKEHHVEQMEESYAARIREYIKKQNESRDEFLKKYPEWFMP